MALSSYSKVLFFFGVQLYRHIKHPNRINTIPTWIEIKQSDYIQHELEHAQTDMSNDNNNIDSQIVELKSSSYQYQVTLIRQKTLWYWIFDKGLGMSKSFSAMWANRFLDWKCTWCVYVLGLSLFFTAIIVGKNCNGTTYIWLQIGVIFLAMVSFLNINKNYFHFKKFSFGVLWKLYNFIVCSIAIWINDKMNNKNPFDELKTETEGHVIDGLNVVGWSIIAVYFSLLPGIFFSDRAQTAVTIALTVYLIYRGLLYYFDTEYDSTITIFNQQVSMRNQIVNRSMDLALWFACQAYQAWKHPKCFFVTQN